MEELSRELKKLKAEIRSGNLSVEKAIVVLSDLINTFDWDQDEEDIKIYKGLFSKASIKKLINTNEESKERIKKFNVILLLQELGFRFTEEEISDILKKITFPKDP